jgi:hypothetical protein
LFSLYVGVVVLRLPQDGLWLALLLGFGWFFFVCCGVAEVFFSTRIHRNRGMWMWVHGDYFLDLTRGIVSVQVRFGSSGSLQQVVMFGG